MESPKSRKSDCVSVMNSVGWTIVGTIVGGALTIIGNVISDRMRIASDRAKNYQARYENLRAERKGNYLRLLDSCRKIRYLARPERPRPQLHLDELGRELFLVSYEIDLVAPPAVRDAANRLAEATRDYLRARVECDEISDPAEVEAAEGDIAIHRARARDRARDFLREARKDLTSEGNSPPDS